MHASDADDRDLHAELREQTTLWDGERAERDAREAEEEARLIAHQEARASDEPYGEAEEDAYERALGGQLRARGLLPD